MYNNKPTTFAGLMPANQEHIDHLRAWLASDRLRYLNCSALDRAAGRPVGTLSRFANKQEHITLRYVGVEAYYPYLQLLGYEPPK
jgi:hypothetical protein